MRIIPALVSAGLVVGVATAVAAQTAPAPTNPNTRVYAYQKTAPAKAKRAAMIRQSKAEETPAHGSAKWWEILNRYNGGGDGAGAP